MRSSVLPESRLGTPLPSDSSPSTPTNDRMKAGRAVSVVPHSGSSTKAAFMSSKPDSAATTSKLPDSRGNGRPSAKSQKPVPKPTAPRQLVNEYEIERNKNIERNRRLMAEALEARGHLDASLPAPRHKGKAKPRKKAEYVPVENRRRGRSAKNEKDVYVNLNISYLVSCLLNMRPQG
jgi:hypothetical protein